MSRTQIAELFQSTPDHLGFGANTFHQIEKKSGTHLRPQFQASVGDDGYAHATLVLVGPEAEIGADQLDWHRPSRDRHIAPLQGERFDRGRAGTDYLEFVGPDPLHKLPIRIFGRLFEELNINITSCFAGILQHPLGDVAKIEILADIPHSEQRSRLHQELDNLYSETHAYIRMRSADQLHSNVPLHLCGMHPISWMNHQHAAHVYDAIVEDKTGEAWQIHNYFTEHKAQPVACTAVGNGAGHATISFVVVASAEAHERLAENWIEKFPSPTKPIITDAHDPSYQIGTHAALIVGKPTALEPFLHTCSDGKVNLTHLWSRHLKHSDISDATLRLEAFIDVPHEQSLSYLRHALNQLKNEHFCYTSLRSINDFQMPSVAASLIPSEGPPPLQASVHLAA